jgi:hypothetical protein
LSVALSDPDDRVKLDAIDAERALFVSKPSPAGKSGLHHRSRTTDVGGDTFAAELALLPRTVPAEVGRAGGGDAVVQPQVRFDALLVFGTLAPLGGRATECDRGVSWTRR